jgi:hypothetical protein
MYLLAPTINRIGGGEEEAGVELGVAGQPCKGGGGGRVSAFTGGVGAAN